jgi:HPt (histidine-containing phosphotransfer) domain-containing protein
MLEQSPSAHTAMEHMVARALERAHGEVADKSAKLLEQIAARESHIAATAAAAAAANEERALRAALHKADKEAAILKAARAQEYARLQALAGVLTDDVRRAAADAARAGLWAERQANQRRLVIARDAAHGEMERG